ncbi:MAG: hypothetical protein UT34_C0001G0468 [candidate division WS6 bacterium GW2011_GWF2_39_15]|uniref:Uncharacterized protein n=1 Tax=candidate division WS6 bacterium GW2011_GWF2_39_15 TaxID=1619100 RepID=A0A0G0MTD4_9BACT|nr:MAG: hypothetical protein UT34_C0001G0468 [candidate division WS6 bacterium GW2011_GWF2_39_15]
MAKKEKIIAEEFFAMINEQADELVGGNGGPTNSIIQTEKGTLKIDRGRERQDSRVITIAQQEKTPLVIQWLSGDTSHVIYYATPSRPFVQSPFPLMFSPSYLTKVIEKSLEVLLINDDEERESALNEFLSEPEYLKALNRLRS